MKISFFLAFMTSILLIQSKSFPDITFLNLFFPQNRNPEDLNLRDWLNKLSIDLPNDLIRNQTKGYIENLTIYNISLESLITTRKKIIDNKIGVEITLRNAGFNVKGKYIFLSPSSKNFLSKISALSIKLPFYLVKNESGLITAVNTTGFTIDLENAQIELYLDTSDIIRNIVLGILKGVLKLIKSNVLEKNMIKIMNEKLENMFEIINNIIINRVEPNKLNILMNETELADVRNSSILGSLAYLLSNITGANGPLSLNELVNIFTNNTGIINLKNIYKKEIHFDFNITDKNNNSLGNLEFSLNDLNISGLNTLREFKAFEPYDSLQLLTYMNLDNFTINGTFSLRIKLYNSSKLVQNETILFEKAQLRTNLQNNKLIAYLQFPFNNKRSLKYSNEECFDMNCVIDLIDSNGTGINALSLNEKLTYVLLDVKEGGDLEEDLDDTINKLADLFITGFSDQIGLLINAFLNTTIINLANQKLNEYLYGISCPGIPDEEISEIEVYQTSMAFGIMGFVFLLFIFWPYILGKACKKRNHEKIKEEENVENKIAMLSDLKDVKEPQTKAKYCFEKIKIKWMKEFGRIDPEGASLFLDPRISIFWRIFIPFSIFLTIAFFVSTNSGIGSSVFAIFNVGRRIQAPSLYEFVLLRSVREMWDAGSWILALLVGIFTGIWPYLMLTLILISFCIPASILSHKNREKFLIILESIAKFTILDTYVVVMMSFAYYFLIDFPLIEQSRAKDGAIVELFVHGAYSLFTLITGTFISLLLTHIIIHLHRSLYSHPDENKGENAENLKSIMSFAKVKCVKDIPFRVIISCTFFLTFGFFIAGSVTHNFSFNFKGFIGYGLDLLKIPSKKELTLIDLGKNLPSVYENPTDSSIIFVQIVFFLSVLVLPLAFLVIIGILWFVPMTRKTQKILYTIAEKLNAWSCIDVFVITAIPSISQIELITKFMVGDKCNTIDPIFEAYFSKYLDGYNTCLKVKIYLEKGFWLFFVAAALFFISSFVILKMCRNALHERLPDHVKEFVKLEKEEKINKDTNFNDSNETEDRTIGKG